MPEPKQKSGYRLGIVNPLTLVGNEITTILRERSFPYEKVAMMDSTGAAAGTLTALGDEPMFVGAASDAELEDLDLVFFCGPSSANRDWIQRSAEDGFVVVDVSQPTTAEDGKVGVAGINLEEIGPSDRVLISPHPIAIPIALILHQIETLSPVSFCAATVIQPASEFEQEGVEELAHQTISVLNVQTVKTSIFDRQLAFNLYPATGHHEEFIVAQIRKLVDPKSELAVMITQGTIFHSHTFSLFVQTQKSLDRETVLAALAANPAIALPEGDQEFGTADAAGRDEVLIAEVRPDPSIRGGFWIWAVCDNLRRGAALNAVLVAERVLFGTK